MRNAAALLVTAVVAFDVHAASEIKVNAAQLAEQFSSGASSTSDIASNYVDRRVALTGTLLSLDEGFTGDVVGKLGDDPDQAVRVAFANPAAVAKIRKRVGQTVTLHCVGAFSTGFATATACRPD
ncbi:hypothetical protein ACFQ3P_12915 [Paraburkholderia sabiae]|jgi:hypothetical protein|uniref:tRNA_anti-like n=1 Tax=Paraburkholderia sabiae TaxID=273251 RepID=A0ABU9QCP6_9BURK|nr:hypothetical protein [Paraburkholderia sabiae]WJZ76001.1 hypothetical protein QEN71_09455 [Paraburkholderia sabiae]CAD6527596.1 hypothetical protein LMG24235_02078 [Paraburkholderia sabiae]